MNNKLIKKEDLSIFDRIRAFFTNIFHKRTSKSTSEEKVNYEKKQTNDFEKNIKINVSELNTKERDLKNFINEIENNPDIIENLSNDRLDRLINYYEDITNAKKRKIERLKLSVN